MKTSEINSRRRVHLFFTFFMLLSALAFYADGSTITISNSKVTDVTVYRSYAKETRIAKASVLEGQSEIVISNVSAYMDENTVQVTINGNVKLLSVSGRMNYLKDNKAFNKASQLEDSLKLLNKDIAWIHEQETSYKNELQILDNNKILANDKQTLKPADLKELVELYRLKSLDIRKIIFELSQRKESIQVSINKMTSQITELNGNNNKPVKEIVLKVSSKEAVNVTFKLNYIVSNSYWIPVYDIRAKNTTDPMKLECRAKVVQNTGYDWNNVKLTLSTANPSSNNDRPILYPIHVDFMQPDYYNHFSQKINSYDNNIMGSANMMQMPSSVTLSNHSIIGGLQLDQSEQNSISKDIVTIGQSDLSVEYAIEDSQDIDADDKEHIVTVQNIELPAVYNYHTVPKLENAAFLLARIYDWGKYNLLAGEANIFLEDMYVGKSYINPNAVSDTLLISLGRDEKINIKRMKLKDFCSTTTFSHKKKETKAFETIIKNNKNSPIEIEILDQFPISQNKDITVELVEAEGAVKVEEYGKLTWKLKILPGQVQKVKLVYSITHPADKCIVEK